MTTHNVGYLIGSLAKASINRKLAKALVRLAPPELEMAEISFKELPLYSYDYDSDFPPAARAFKEAIAAVDAVLFVTPEYNRSIPGGLKNAIDWASRPYGKNSFTRKPSAVIGTSPGAIGTAVGLSTRLVEAEIFRRARRRELIEFLRKAEEGRSEIGLEWGWNGVGMGLEWGWNGVGITTGVENRDS
jgi:hypothetical protein